MSTKLDISTHPFTLTYMNSDLKNNVQSFRKEKGSTQQQLADAVGVTRQTIIAIEKGNYTPSLSLGLSLAHYFNVPVEDLFYL